MLEQLKNDKTPYVIIVGVDFETDGDMALAGAMALASDRDLAEVHLVFADSAQANANDPRGGQARGEELLGKLEDAARQAHENLNAIVGHKVKKITLMSHYRVGAPANEVVQLAVDLDADLIVVGTHGRRGVSRLVMGSVASTILKKARCPVFVVRPKDHQNVGEVPEIEAPCPNCLDTRSKTFGKQMWCERHANMRRFKPHHYSYKTNDPTSRTAWGPAFD